MVSLIFAMDISIIILNYKQKGLVKQCVKGILASQPRLKYEIIVIDNDSNDSVLPMVQQLLSPPDRREQHDVQMQLDERYPLPPFQVIASPRNVGFAAGNNLGIRKASGDFLLVMNPDVAIVPGSLEGMVEFMHSHSDAGIIGPRLINPDGSVQHSCRHFPSLLVPLYRRTFIGKLPFARRVLANYLMQNWDHNRDQQVDWLFGAALLIRRSLVEKIGLFDERFFVYFEDLDLCRRSWEAGFSVWYVAGVELVHYHQRLSAEGPALFSLFRKATRIHLASGVKYYAKYLGAKPPRHA